MTPSHASALERAREKVVECAKTTANGARPVDYPGGLSRAVGALLALESQTCEECGGTGVDPRPYPIAGDALYRRCVFVQPLDGRPSYWECPAGCDHGRKRTEGER